MYIFVEYVACLHLVVCCNSAVCSLFCSSPSIVKTRKCRSFVAFGSS